MSIAQRVDLGHARRAETVLQRILDLQPEGRAFNDEIRRRLRGLPAMLRVNGVPAVLAFYAAKAAAGGEGINKAYGLVRDALCDELYEFLDVPEDQRSLEQLFRRLTDQDPAVLAVAFARLEAFAGWISRLAEARRVAPRTGPAAGTAKQAMPVETAIGMGTRPARGSHRPTLS